MEDSVSIDIDLIRKKLSQSSNPSFGPTTSIFRVDKRIRKMNEEAYTPDTISIGPYHSDKQNLQMQAMEDLKLRYAQALLIRTSERTSLENYMEALKKVETEARRCYSEPINHKENFIEMLLFDGFFIIELFRKSAEVVKPDDDDPIFYSNLRRARVVRDLLLPENQIPISVLQTLFDLSKDPNSDTKSFIELALKFFEGFIAEAIQKYPQNNKTIRHKHLLDLLSYTLESSLPHGFMKKPPTSAAVLESLSCVTELRNSGVKFRKRADCNFIDIKFSEGVFEIPELWVDDYTDTFFRNIIAYEQHCYGGRHYITSYALLMDFLINTADDVAILRGCGIIKNHLGDDNKVSSLINNLCNEVSTKHFCYGDLCYKVREYYNSPYNKWIETLRRDYCNSPWTIISVIAAILLLLLTIWLAVFAAFPVFNVHV
ncbi:UPF0481 protein At3g47200-like [Macadamia integrifolia]|uniref:UPF0481 protein At3g47200-like n=1 Tax=Macadamia integrifolia TaxID=60698 RepID=UPI001C4EF907|nr:UPF0481 protein At3g47200-like [Macadamia integrifolia]